MPSFRQHCDECEAALGEPFERVHRWLDEFAKLDLLTHRGRRHHREGVEEIRAMWGDRAAQSAEIHVRSDFGSVPTRGQAEKWSLMGPDGVPDGGGSFLTDEDIEKED